MCNRSACNKAGRARGAKEEGWNSNATEKGDWEGKEEGWNSNVTEKGDWEGKEEGWNSNVTDKGDWEGKEEGCNSNVTEKGINGWNVTKQRSVGRGGM